MVMSMLRYGVYWNVDVITYQYLVRKVIPYPVIFENKSYQYFDNCKTNCTGAQMEVVLARKATKLHLISILHFYTIQIFFQCSRNTYKLKKLDARLVMYS